MKQQFTSGVLRLVFDKAMSKEFDPLKKPSCSVDSSSITHAILLE